MIRHGAVTFFAVLLSGVCANAADQTQIGAGIARAQQIGSASALVESAVDLLTRNAGRIEDPQLRAVTLDSFLNANTCIRHRANVTDAVKNQIIASLLAQNLVNPADAASITGGVKAGVFPPVIGDGSACPTLPMTFNATPGSNFGGHHSYPGGLAVHESSTIKVRSISPIPIAASMGSRVRTICRSQPASAALRISTSIRMSFLPRRSGMTGEK